MNFKLQQTKLDCVSRTEKNMGITRSTRQLAISDGSADIRNTHIYTILSYTQHRVGLNWYTNFSMYFDVGNLYVGNLFALMAPSSDISCYWNCLFFKRNFILI